MSIILMLPFSLPLQQSHGKVSALRVGDGGLLAAVPGQVRAEIAQSVVCWIRCTA